MSTSNTCQLLGRSLISWLAKKQNSVALPTAEAEYISAGSFCAQLLWMKATLNNFGIKFKNVSLLRDNESAIKMTQNPVQHSRTKHIDIRHHFIRDHQQKGDISIESIGTKDQLADIFTKPLNERRFCKLRNELNILDFSNLRREHPHIYIWHAPPPTKQGKVGCHSIHTLLRTWLEHIDMFAW